MSDLKAFVVMSIILVGFITGLSNFASNMFVQYGSDAINSSEFQSFEKSSENYEGEITSFADNQTRNAETGNVAGDIKENFAFLPSLWTGLTNTATAAKDVTSLGVSAMSNSDYIPPYIITVFSSGVVIFVIYSLFSRG